MLKIFIHSLVSCLFVCFLSADSLTPSTIQKGRILFLIQQGEHEQALKLYQTAFQEVNAHDYELLHQIGLRILEEGFRQKDPECQLLALFGASVSAHEDAFYILEESLKNPIPEIQLVALEALARFQTDKADLSIMRALGAPTLEVRYEAARHLCKKKHQQAVSQTESLLYKSPEEVWTIYPPLFAMVGDFYSAKVLRKLFAHSSKNVRLTAILSVAKYHREDLLPQIRQQSAHLQFTLQEACAHALGALKDDHSIPRLEQLAQSASPYVALAANQALYHLGKIEALQAIEKAAREKDVFAIAVLGELREGSSVLLALSKSPIQQIRINALISLLQQNHPRAIEQIDEILVRDQRDLAFTLIHSPGKVFKAWKVTPSASTLLKEDIAAYQEHLNLKETLLRKLRQLSESHFFSIAHQLFNRQQNDLIPIVVELLEELNTHDAIECIKKHQQQLGAPLIRNYCNLSLFRLNESGPYAEQLRQWVKAQSRTEFIRLKPVSPWELDEDAYTLKPEETSRLLIESFEAFASHQDAIGVETLIEAIATGHAKNKYALAGLLLRATE